MASHIEWSPPRFPGRKFSITITEEHLGAKHELSDDEVIMLCTALQEYVARHGVTSRKSFAHWSLRRPQ